MLRAQIAFTIIIIYGKKGLFHINLMVNLIRLASPHNVTIGQQIIELVKESVQAM